MAKLIYSAITSLDGYIADADGDFDWAEPDEEVHTFVNDLQRPPLWQGDGGRRPSSTGASASYALGSIYS